MKISPKRKVRIKSKSENVFRLTIIVQHWIRSPVVGKWME